ncbi:MAG: hypothetical protein J6D21_00770, partial [Clostridia bacterium]|nr:hypothetical protein [Clostridia bacterium]
IAKGQVRVITEAYANGLVEPDSYEFDADGKMIVPEEEEPDTFTGIREDYYYEDGKIFVGGKGMVEFEGNLYYVLYSGKIAKGQIRVVTEAYANGLVTPDSYEFDADGKMIK